jgi:hypothetical protein
MMEEKAKAEAKEARVIHVQAPGRTREGARAKEGKGTACRLDFGGGGCGWHGVRNEEPQTGENEDK